MCMCLVWRIKLENLERNPAGARRKAFASGIQLVSVSLFGKEFELSSELLSQWILPKMLQL